MYYAKNQPRLFLISKLYSASFEFPIINEFIGLISTDADSEITYGIIIRVINKIINFFFIII